MPRLRRSLIARNPLASKETSCVATTIVRCSTIRRQIAAIQQLRALGACVGKRKAQWTKCFGRAVPLPKGDRDVIAVHSERRLLWIAEVEGDSGGQPEGKIYKALGQLVCAATEMDVLGFERWLTLVAWGPAASSHRS